MINGFWKAIQLVTAMMSNGTIMTSNVCAWKNIILRKILLYLCLKLCLRIPSLRATWSIWKDALFGVRLSAMIGSKIIVEQTIRIGLQQLNSISKEFMGGFRQNHRKCYLFIMAKWPNGFVGSIRALINTSFTFAWSKRKWQHAWRKQSEL